MHKLVILIPNTVNGVRFDASWPEFIKHSQQMPGLRREVTSRTGHHLYGRHQFLLTHELHFDDQSSLEVALNSEPGTIAGQVLQKITNGQVILFFADHLEDDPANYNQPKSETVDPE